MSALFTSRCFCVYVCSGARKTVEIVAVAYYTNKMTANA